MTALQRTADTDSTRRDEARSDLDAPPEGASAETASAEPTTADAAAREAERHARQAVDAFRALAQRTAGLDLPIDRWDGVRLGPAKASWRLVLPRPWSLRAMLVPPTDLTMGEAYARGDIDIAGDAVAAIAASRALRPSLDDAEALVPLTRHLLAGPRPPLLGSERRARLSGRAHTRERDREAVSFHYDLPQAFYETFLDEQLVYSCGYFAEAAPTDLDRAQRRKLDMVCRKLRLRPGSRLLDIGCGWGSLLAWAAQHYGATGVGVTLSETQAEAANERLARAGLSDRVEVRLADYRELSTEEPFDAVCSIGMVEHVGDAQLTEYAQTTRRLLAPGGLTLVHAITRQGEAPPWPLRNHTFIQRHVFPDGELVPAWRLLQAVEQAGLPAVDVHQLRHHYALTLRQWVARLEASAEQAIAATSEADYRVWRLFMSGAAASFAAGHIGVVQVLAGDRPAAPLTRDWMHPTV